MIRRPTLAGALIAAGALLSTLTGPMAGPAAAAEPPPAWTMEDLGAASVATPTGSGHFIGDQLWFSTRQTSPPAVIGLDPATNTAASQIELPEGQGAWVTAVSGTDVYVGTYTPAKLFRVDTVAGEVTEILTAGDAGAVVYALDVAPDGVVYAGTYSTSGGRIFSYDPGSEAVEDLGVVVDDQDYVRALVADDDYVYAGIGAKAHLIRIDRSTGERTDLTPPELAGATFVSSLALHDGVVLGGISPRGQLLVLDTADPSRYELVQAPNETFVVAVTGGEPGRAYFAARPSGTLYGYDLWSGSAEKLTVPAPEMAANGLTFHDGTVWGLVDGLAYAYDPVGGNLAGYPLDAAGVPPSPERPMALAADDERVYVSGSGGVQVHDLGEGGSARIFVPGEAKSLWPTGESVYLSVYTRALIYTLDPDDSTVEFLAGIENEQTRPRDSFFQPGSGRLLVGTEPDYGRYGGALAVYDTEGGGLDVYRDIVLDQSVSAVTAIDDVGYLGSDVKSGLGTTPRATRAELTAVDLTSGDVLWSVPAPASARTVTDLVEVDGTLVGITSTGLLFGVDPATGTVGWQRQAGPTGGTLTTTSSGVYTTDGATLYRLSWPTGRPAGAAPAVEPIQTGLGGELYGVPAVAATLDGSRLFAIRGRTLTSLDVPDQVHVTTSAEASSSPVGSGQSGAWVAKVRVTFTDAYGHPLRAAVVTGRWDRPGPGLPAGCVTADDGSCTFTTVVTGRADVTLSLGTVRHGSLPGGEIDSTDTVTAERPED